MKAEARLLKHVQQGKLAYNPERSRIGSLLPEEERAVKTYLKRLTAALEEGLERHKALAHAFEPWVKMKGHEAFVVRDTVHGNAQWAAAQCGLAERFPGKKCCEVDTLARKPSFDDDPDILFAHVNVESDCRLPAGHLTVRYEHDVSLRRINGACEMLSALVDTDPHNAKLSTALAAVRAAKQDMLAAPPIKLTQLVSPFREDRKGTYTEEDE